MTAAPRPPGGPPPRVLVVEDDADMRALAEQVLAADGFEVESVVDGRAALARLAPPHDLPDVVVLDVQLPELDGWETLRRIRGSPPTADLPVVLATVRAQRSDRQLGWQLGCDGYVVKPYTVGALRREVDAVLARSPDQRRAHRAAELRQVSAGWTPAPVPDALPPGR